MSADDSVARILVDAHGVEWEVYDEAESTLALALDWDHRPQPDDPGLIFSSAVDRRRLWPCPRDWRAHSDSQLLELLARARSVL